MNRIREVFHSAEERGGKVFIPFITSADPDFETTERLCLIFEKNGADIIELGVPFSDPLADGPVIQRASQRSLARGTNLREICGFVKVLRKQVKTPIALMSYYNTILRPGLDISMEWISGAGVDGLICPDLPPQEGEALISISKKYGIANIFFLAPTSTKSRVEFVANKTTGFIYYVSVTGVTGARNKLPATIRDHLKQIKEITDLPVAVGFGVSNSMQAAQIAKWADGVIIGSAIIKILEEDNFSDKSIERVAQFVKDIKSAV